MATDQERYEQLNRRKGTMMKKTRWSCQITRIQGFRTKRMGKRWRQEKLQW